MITDYLITSEIESLQTIVISKNEQVEELQSMLEKKDEIMKELESIQERKSYVTFTIEFISNIFSHNYRSQATTDRNI